MLIKKNRRTIIGILGGGQLARMSLLAAQRIGFDVAILEKQRNSPAGQLTKHEFVGWVDDENIFNDFIAASDIITLENEFIDSSYLKKIELMNKMVLPTSKTIGLIQDKLTQKKTLKRAGLPVADFTELNSYSNYKQIAKKIGGKFLIKTRKMGYDGYGNFSVSSEDDFQFGVKKLSERNSLLMAEEFVSFKKELAIMVARTKNETAVYPVVETIQENHICKIILAPAQIPSRKINEAKEIAVAAVEAVHGFGIFGIEFFYTDDDKILINEMAPRPHNSGHYSIDACITSQFENHIRALLNLPLGSTAMKQKFAVMINLLGKRNGTGVIQNYNTTFEKNDFHLHIYNKEESRIGRKMGHITMTGNNLNLILRKIKSIDKQIEL